MLKNNLLDLVHYLVYYIPMIKLNIHEAKTHLSKYLELLKDGSYIILCNRNVPVAEIRGLELEGQEERKLGLSKGEIEIGEGFFEPLPDEFTNYFGQHQP